MLYKFHKIRMVWLLLTLCTNHAVAITDVMYNKAISEIKCDGQTDDTVAINHLLNRTARGLVSLPAGNCLYQGGGILQAGVTLQGQGRNATTLVMTTAKAIGLTVSGYGAGLRSLGFKANVLQTGGSYVVLSGIESFLEDFEIDGDYNGVLMTGNVSRIRHGRFQNGAKQAIRIRAEGGDNSQMIEDVLMGAQEPQIALAGIRVRHSSALIIHDTSVIQQGVGLLIDPYTDNKTGATDAGSVYSLWVYNSFFDNSSGAGIKIAPTGNANVVRSRFSNNWTGSSGKEGFLINNQGTGMVSGIQILGHHALLNQGNGISLVGKLEDISIDNNLIAQNAIGIQADNIKGLRITNSTIGKGGGVEGNQQAINIAKNVDKLMLQGNDITQNATTSAIATTKDKIIKGNFGLPNN